jgi:phage terminase large subunit GpA-like protein
MHDPRDFKVELNGASQPAAPSTPKAAPAGARPYLSVHFACCNVYLRIYRSADGRHYRGRCPRCGRAVNFAVGQGGTSDRVFVVR